MRCPFCKEELDHVELCYWQARKAFVVGNRITKIEASKAQTGDDSEKITYAIDCPICSEQLGDYFDKRVYWEPEVLKNSLRSYKRRE